MRFLIGLLLLLLTGCGKQTSTPSPLVGTWVNGRLTSTLTFGADLSYKQVVSDSGGPVAQFTGTYMDNGSSVRITTVRETFDAPYTISGSSLTITYNSSGPLVYTKQ